MEKTKTKEEKYYCPHCGWVHNKHSLKHAGDIMNEHGGKVGVVLKCDACDSEIRVIKEEELELLKKYPYEQLQTKCDKIIHDFNTFKVEAEEKEKQLKKRMLHTERMLESANKELGQYRQDYADLKKEHMKLEKENEKFKQGHLRELYNNKANQYDKAMAELEKANAKIKELEDQIAVMSNEAESTKYIFKLLGEKKELEKQIGDYNLLRERYDEIVTGYDNLYKENEHLRKEVQELDGENATLNKENDFLDEQLDKEKVKYRSLEKSYIDVKADYQKLEKENKELKEMLDKRNKDYMDVCLIADRRNMTIESLSEENKVLKEKLDDLYYMPLDGPAYTVLKKDYDNTRDKYIDLIDKYNELATEHGKLKYNYKAEVRENGILRMKIDNLKRPDYPALLKRYTDLQKDHEQLDKDFKDLYGRYEKQLNKNNHLTYIMNSLYGIPGITGMEMLKEEKEKLLKENEVLKTELEAKQYYIEKLEAQTVFEEIFFGKTSIAIEDVMNILNAWFVLNDNRLVDLSSCIFIDGIKTPRHEIAIYNRIDSTKDPKEYAIVKKAMDIKLCQSK